MSEPDGRSSGAFYSEICQAFFRHPLKGRATHSFFFLVYGDGAKSIFYVNSSYYSLIRNVVFLFFRKQFLFLNIYIFLYFPHIIHLIVHILTLYNVCVFLSTLAPIDVILSNSLESGLMFIWGKPER